MRWRNYNYTINLFQFSIFFFNLIGFEIKRQLKLTIKLVPIFLLRESKSSTCSNDRFVRKWSDRSSGQSRRLVSHSPFQVGPLIARLPIVTDQTFARTCYIFLRNCLTLTIRINRRLSTFFECSFFMWIEERRDSSRASHHR